MVLSFAISWLNRNIWLYTHVLKGKTNLVDINLCPRCGTAPYDLCGKLWLVRLGSRIRAIRLTIMAPRRHLINLGMQTPGTQITRSGTWQSFLRLDSKNPYLRYLFTIYPTSLVNRLQSCIQLRYYEEGEGEEFSLQTSMGKFSSNDQNGKIETQEQKTSTDPGPQTSL